MLPPSISTAFAPNCSPSQRFFSLSATNSSPVATTPICAPPYIALASSSSTFAAVLSQGNSSIFSVSKSPRRINRVPSLSPRALVSKSCCTQLSAATKSPIFTPTPPATPVFIMSLGLYFSIIICVHTAAFTFPGPHWDTTTGTPSSVPLWNTSPAIDSLCSPLSRDMILLTSTSIAPIMPMGDLFSILYLPFLMLRLHYPPELCPSSRQNVRPLCRCTLRLACRAHPAEPYLSRLPGAYSPLARCTCPLPSWK